MEATACPCQSQLCTGPQAGSPAAQGCRKTSSGLAQLSPSFSRHRLLQVSSPLLPMVPCCTCLKVTTALKQSSRSPTPSPLHSSPSEHSLVTPVPTVREEAEHTPQAQSVFFFHTKIVLPMNIKIRNQRQFLVILP